MADVFEGIYPKVVVAPLALATILDAHSRRGKRECLCALVGTLNDDGSLSVTDAVVNFEERGMPSKQHHESFIIARQRVNPRELLLGWATTSEGNLTMSNLHDIASWARTDTKSSRFIPQRRLPAPVSMIVSPPTAKSDLSVACEVRGPNNAIKSVPLEYLPCFISEFDSANASTETNNITEEASAACIAQVILKRIEQVLEIAKKAKANNDIAVGRQLLSMVALPGFDVEEFMKVDKEEAALFEWIKNLAELQIELNHKQQTAVAAAP